LSLSPSEQTGIIALGATMMAAAGSGAFRLASLRGDTNSKWSRRVPFAVSALNEKATLELEELRDEINELLPTGSESNPVAIDPDDVVTAPAALSERTKTIADLFGASARMESDLAWLIRLGPVLVGSLGTFALAAALLTVFYAQLLDWSALRVGGLIMLAISVATLVVATVVYIVLQHRLASDEIRAGTGGRGDQGHE
jgi:hypothetical protein